MQQPTSVQREERQQDLSIVLHEQWLNMPKTRELINNLKGVREHYLTSAEDQALVGGNIEVIRVFLIKAGAVKQNIKSIENNDYKKP